MHIRGCNPRRLRAGTVRPGGARDSSRCGIRLLACGAMMRVDPPPVLRWGDTSSARRCPLLRSIPGPCRWLPAPRSGDKPSRVELPSSRSTQPQKKGAAANRSFPVWRSDEPTSRGCHRPTTRSGVHGRKPPPASSPHKNPYKNPWGLTAGAALASAWAVLGGAAFWLRRRPRMNPGPTQRKPVETGWGRLFPSSARPPLERRV